MRKLLNQLVNVAKESAVLDSMLRYNPVFYRSVRQLLSEMESMSFSDRRTLSENLRERVLGWGQAIPAYPSSSKSLSDWPILEKEELRLNQAHYRNKKVFSIPGATGGTTGVPIRLWRSLGSVAAEQAFFDHILTPLSIRCRTARIARLCGDDVKDPSDRTPPFGKKTQYGKRLILSSKHVSAETASWYANALKSFTPDILLAYANSAVFLARHCLEQRLKVKVPIVISSSEILYPSGRELIEQAFDAHIIEQYGSAERVIFSVSYQPGQFYFNPAYGDVELQPVDGSAPAGFGRAEVIATGYWNKAMPLIRYRLGDSVLFPDNYTKEDLERVSLGLKPICAVEGRDKAFLLSPRGEEISLITLPWETTNIIRMQVIQERVDYVLIKVVPEREFSASDRDRLIQMARKKFPADMQLEIEVVKQLEKLPSGKVPYIIRKVTGDPTYSRQSMSQVTMVKK